jgi:hypothetical protein
MGRDIVMNNESRIKQHGGPGTGRDVFLVPPSAPLVGPLIKMDEDGNFLDDPSIGAGITYTALATATDHLLMKIHTREASRGLYLNKVNSFCVYLRLFTYF